MWVCAVNAILYVYVCKCGNVSRDLCTKTLKKPDFFFAFVCININTKKFRFYYILSQLNCQITLTTLLYVWVCAVNAILYAHVCKCGNVSCDLSTKTLKKPDFFFAFVCININTKNSDFITFSHSFTVKLHYYIALCVSLCCECYILYVYVHKCGNVSCDLSTKALKKSDFFFAFVCINIDINTRKYLFYYILPSNCIGFIAPLRPCCLGFG